MQTKATIDFYFLKLVISDFIQKKSPEVPSSPEKTAKSTKNFDDRGAAYAHLAEKGVGIIKEIPGEPKRCGYCDAWDVCQQRQRYFPDDAGHTPNRG